MLGEAGTYGFFSFEILLKSFLCQQTDNITPPHLPWSDYTDTCQHCYVLKAKTASHQYIHHTVTHISNQKPKLANQLQLHLTYLSQLLEDIYEMEFKY